MLEVDKTKCETKSFFQNKIKSETKMPNSKKTVARRALFALLVALTFISGGWALSNVARASSGINQRINFQGRLLTSQGATVPDGYYNIQFKVYQDGDGQTAGNTTGSPAGSLKWTESYLNANSQGVLVKNGYMSVELGSITPFGSSVDWNQDTLWLSINIGSTNGSCTPFSSCTPDGEMLPMRRFSATPYALNAGQLNGLTGGQFVQLAQGVQTEAGNNTSSIYLNKTGTGGNFMQLQSAGTDVFTVSNSGDILLGNNANHSLSVATSAADTVGRDLTVGAGAGGSGTGSAGGNLVLQGGAAGGTDGNGGNVTINAGAKTGTGTDGVVSIGTTNTSGITLGVNTTVAANQNLAFASGNGSFDQSASTGTFKTGTGAVSLNGDTTVASGKGLTVTNGTTNLTGTTNINTTGSAGTTIGSASGGAVSITANAASSFTTTSGSLTLQGSGGTVLTTAAGTTSSGLTLSTGNASSGASGNITLDVGTATTTTGAIAIGTVNASSVTIGSSTGSVIVQNGLTSGVSAGTGTFTNNGSTKNTSLALGDLAAGSIGSAATTVDTYTSFTISPSASGRTYTIPAPTDGAAGRIIYISNINATNSFIVNGTTLNAHSSATLVYDGSGWNFSGVDGGSSYIQNQSASAQSGNYWISGVARADTSVLTPNLDSATATTLKIGAINATAIEIGNLALASGTQTINIGTNNTAGGTTNITIGNGASATAGTTTVQAKDSVSVATNGVTRATFNNTNTLYLGNGVTAGAPNNFTLSGTGSSTSGVSGGTLTVQGGSATAGNANGGNLVLTGGTGTGTGTSGLVVLTTPTFSTITNDANCFPSGTESTTTTNCTISASSVNSNSAVIVGFTNDGQTAFMPDPTILTAGRVVYVTASNLSKDFTLSVNGGGQGNQIAMRKNTTATMIWNGADWTAAGASSSTTLQAAYDNTLQSAGGAELVVSKTSSTNGMTIRDSSVNPVNGTLLSVQTSSAASLISINGNVTEYATNAGAETAGASATTFPASTWTNTGLATVTRQNVAGDYISTGQGSVAVATTGAGGGAKNQLSSALSANTTYNVSFTTRLTAGAATFTDMNVQYSADGGTSLLTSCSAAATSNTSIWTKVNCTFTTPSSGITSANGILIRQTGATARTFYVDNLSVTIAADYNFATDGGASDNTNFATNWTTAGAGTVSVTRNTADGYNASDSANVNITAGAVNAGLRNKLSSTPLASTLYRITAYAKSSNSFTDFKVRYSRDGGTSYVDCVDYNTQTISTSAWTKVTCYVKTDAVAASNPYVYFVEGSSNVRSFGVDAFNMSISTITTPNVQIGGGVNGGPTTLLTLDKGASAPIASDNDALLGSMYYDTTLGKLQCYEADGWGACGSSPDNIVTISPEYTNAVLYGDGVGTMTSSLCSDALNINDASNGTSICGTNETYNFYRWTSPQASDQKYSIYVTYQLPSTFKSFNSGQTSVQGRVDNTSNAYVKLQIYKNQNSGGGLTACGNENFVTTTANTWQAPVASGTADPSTCGFSPGDSIVFKITTGAKTNANAYVGNLNFSFNNR